MGQNLDAIVSQKWREGFVLGLKWIATGIIIALIVAIITQDPTFTMVGLFGGVIGAFLWTSYRKHR